MILLVFKPRVAGSCHNKTEGMLAEAQREQERKEGKRERDLWISLACLLLATTGASPWNGCI